MAKARRLFCQSAAKKKKGDLMRNVQKVILFGIIVGFMLSGCTKAPVLVQVPMDYTPTNPVEPPRNIKNTPIYFASFEDRRNNPDQIGENTEKGAPVPAKASPQEVMSSLEKAFNQEFKRAGLNVVDSRDKAERIVVVTLQNLWVQEKNTFDASVVARVEVKDRSGQVLASDGFKGMKSRWGSSYSPEEYRKAISDAYLELLKNMFTDDGFMQKWL
jgi:uncharacterized lipoprotein YajG